MRDNVISFDHNLSGARRRVVDARVQELVLACRGQLADTLPRLMQELFEHVDDELYQLADKSASDVLQTRYFDAMRELRKLREQIEQGFLSTALAEYEAFWTQPQQADNASGDVANDELSLVDEEELEENLAVSGMVSKAENRYHRELFALNMRFAQMAGIADLTITQDGADISILTSRQDTYVGTVAGDIVDWAGSYVERGGAANWPPTWPD